MDRDIERLRVTRRELMRLGAAGLGALALPDLAHAQSPVAAHPMPAKAHSVIQLWMGGGPSHIDTFDPKPDGGADVCGPLKTPIETNVKGIRISQLLPLLAKQADKYTIIRSMTHSNNGHETATYIVQTGSLPSADLVYPAIGAVVALKKGYSAGYRGILPPYISLTSPLGRFAEEGFLGAEYQTFATGGNPASPTFSVEGIVPPRNVTEQRLKDRKALLTALDKTPPALAPDPAYREAENSRRQAFQTLQGDARKVFDLSQEKKELRDQYGMNPFGQSCLLARRLVENGVPFITINMGGWDTHTLNFPAMARLCPVLDAGFATLLADLAQHGLLGTTIVEWIGEFGRTPKIAYEEPWEGGRHHYGQVFSAVVAGGGFRGGMVVGESDARGEKVKSRPVYPWDLTASIYKLLGIDPMGTLPHPQGCVARVTPLASGDLPTGGILSEIM